MSFNKVFLKNMPNPLHYKQTRTGGHRQWKEINVFITASKKHTEIGA